MNMGLHDVLKVIIPEDINLQDLQRGFSALPLSRRMIFDSDQIARAIDSNRSILSQEAVADFMSMLMNFGKKEITTPEAAHLLAYGWNASELPIIQREAKGRMRQMQAFNNGELSGSEIPVSSALYTEAQILNPELRKEFLRAIAGRMLIEDLAAKIQEEDSTGKTIPTRLKVALTAKDVRAEDIERALKATRKGLLPPSREFILGLALFKLEIRGTDLNDWDMQLVNTLEIGMDRFKEFEIDQILSNAVTSKSEPVPAQLFLAAEMMVLDFVNDTRLKNEIPEKEPGVNVRAIEDLISAA
jgi:hypothetical protein